ncbi:MAG: hypothetical protein IT350_01650 [Deltaproteobacteria bacterium]|nr:hypothetical protein [Deltaproteobacteria bacterium]
MRIGTAQTLILTLGVALSATFGASARAQDPADGKTPGVEIVVTAEPNEITVGDEVRYRITVTWDPANKVEQKALEENLGDLVVREQLGVDLQTLPDGRSQRTEGYVITSYLVGKYKLPPPAVRFTNAAGAELVLDAEPIILNVRSVTPDDATDIRDIKPPRAVPRDLRQVGMYAAIAFAAIASIIAGIVAWRHFRRKPEPETPPLPAHEHALARLAAAREFPRATHDEIKAYYVEISAALREYLDRRFAVPAPLLTTYQLRDALRGRTQMPAGDGAAHFGALFDVLDTADFVKFAKFDPDADGQNADLDSAIRFVEATRPPEPTESATDAPAAPPNENAA